MSTDELLQKINAQLTCGNRTTVFTVKTSQYGKRIEIDGLAETSWLKTAQINEHLRGVLIGIKTQRLFSFKISQ